MDIGIPREIKPGEGRVALLPRHVVRLTEAGHRVVVEAAAGVLAEGEDSEYAAAGATIVESSSEVFERSKLIVKVKEILAPEYDLLGRRHILFTNIHSALNRELTDVLLGAGVVAIAAEETHAHGSPNSVLAGEIGAFEGIRLCLAPFGGSGRHFTPHFGAPPLRAVVIGLGNVGRGALRTLLRLGATVVGLDIDAAARAQAKLDWDVAGLLTDDISSLERYLVDADLVLNGVLWPKHRADHLVDRAKLSILKPTAVIVDVSCDTAGAIETTRPTTWSDPVYVVDGVRHFCVDNIPGAVPIAASAGYADAILPSVLKIAEEGALPACRDDVNLRRGLTCAGGDLILEETGRLQDRPYTPVDLYLAAGSP